MSRTKFLVAIAIVLILNENVHCKKNKKNKTPKNDEEDSTPQPSVVTYSTFGFNDVGSYDGFIPSSPDYVNYLSGANQDSATKLYAPAFPTAMESTGFANNNYGNQQLEGQAFKLEDDGGPQASMLKYSHSPVNFFNTPSFDSSDIQIQNAAPEEVYERNADETNSPVYGTKITSRHKSKAFTNFNETDFNEYGSSNPSENKYNSIHTADMMQQNKPVSFGESSNSFQNMYNNYAPTYLSTDVEESTKTTERPSSIKFPRVIDYTKIKNYYPTEIENKYLSDSGNPSSVQHDSIYFQNDNTNTKYDIKESKFTNPAPIVSQYNHFEYKNNDNEMEKEESQGNSHNNKDASHSYARFTFNKNKKQNDYKDRNRNKNIVPSLANSNYFKSWVNPTKGYEYSTNYSNTRFKFNYGGGRKPNHNNGDEVVPASSNIIDFPEFDNSFKKFPYFKPHINEDFTINQAFKNNEKFKQDEYINQFTNLYSTIPTTTSHWGNAFKTNEYSSFKHHPRKPQFDEDYSDDIVHIPKRPPSFKHNYGKYENKPSEQHFFPKYRPHKQNKLPNNWNNEIVNTRFKSEEDLLGLRTHDTSHPSYLPTYKPFNEGLSDDSDYKKLVEKWRQSYLKAKYKDSYNDYESFETETKPVHVPVPKPYPIEVPHPVIVPVPQPYPVRVPVPKPVAVPVIKELTVPVEKPVPYPVVKKVPYPVEKPVPVPVEKQVSVPVIKPYPVMIPHIRPVFHHPKHHEENDGYAEIEEEIDYSPRPKKTPYAKRPKNTRNRLRKPTRPSYQYHDKNRRRWPVLKPSGFTRDHRNVRIPSDYQTPYKYQEELSDYDSEQNNYYACKRNGNNNC